MSDERVYRGYMEGQLKRALADIEIPDSYYEKAETAYNSICNDLTAQNCDLSALGPEAMLQGSMRLGTAVKPIDENGSYDVDMVCNLRKLSKSDTTQAHVKKVVGDEVKKYAKRHGMTKPPHEGKRCWTLEYVDDANFHIDILPTIDDTSNHADCLRNRGFGVPDDARFLAHTDKRHPRYSEICSDWASTNPRGYARWFFGVADLRTYRERLAKAHSVSAESIRPYRVKTPLQQYVQLLKRHRDVFLSNQQMSRGQIRSVVVTTLAAKAYEQITYHSGWYNDFIEVVQGLSTHIRKTPDGCYELTNPADQLENFLKDWREADATLFYRWCEAVSDDLGQLPSTLKKGIFNRYPARSIRESLGLPKQSSSGCNCKEVRGYLDRLPHHKQHGGIEINLLSIKIKAEKMRNGGVFVPFESDNPLPKNVSLRFSAAGDNFDGFTLKWQVTNDGLEANAANCLRGDFYLSDTSARGRKARGEKTCYIGRHYVECVAEKDGVVYGRSDPFVVNITNDDASRRNW